MMNEWDLIAKSFNSTRKQAWKECLDFIAGIKGISLDIGCGNARHLVYMAKKCDISFGIDSSYEMIKIAKEQPKDSDAQE